MAAGVLMSMACMALAVLVVLPGRSGAGHRLRPRERPRPATVRGIGPRVGWLARWPWHAAAGAGLLVGGGVGGRSGVVAGLGAFALAGWRLRRAASDVLGEAHRRAAADLPLIADLLAACLSAGAQPDAAADAVGRAVGGPGGDELRRVAAALRLGGDPTATWLSLPPPQAVIGRAFARAAETGAPLADLLTGVAAEERGRQRAAAEVAARRVGVQAAAPLGLCFLPAFVLLAVVPVIAGLVRSLDVLQ